MSARLAAFGVLALILGACAEEATQRPAPVAATPPAQAAPAEPVPDVPHVYLAIQPDPSGATSVVFAIDERRNNTPLDDPAIRLTPEDGQCNPQQLRRYNFPPESAARPIFGPEEVQSGITARDLPNFMAMAVTSEMMRMGLIVNPDESQPQNVCSRKLWEQLVVVQSGG
ncbi:MAG: hypothetical protein AAF674_09830 [Pseudomonadota bacterium]